MSQFLVNLENETDIEVIAILTSCEVGIDRLRELKPKIILSYNGCREGWDDYLNLVRQINQLNGQEIPNKGDYDLETLLGQEKYIGAFEKWIDNYIIVMHMSVSDNTLMLQDLLTIGVRLFIGLPTPSSYVAQSIRNAVKQYNSMKDKPL